MQKAKFSSVLGTAIFCFCFWELLTCSLGARDVILGLIFSVLVAMFSAWYFVHEGENKMYNPIRLLVLAFYYVVILFKEIIKANMDVAFRVFEKEIKVNPGIVKIPVDLKNEYALSLMANSITLTPGTMTLEIAEEDNGQNYYYIHWLDVATREQKEAGASIKGPMESWIRRIWQ